MAYCSERTRSLKDALSRLLQDLSYSASEEGISTALRKAHSLGRIKTAKEYRRDRQSVLKKITTVPRLRRHVVQYEEMLKEVEASGLIEYTPSTLPLLLHQFYSDRVSQLVQMKHNLQVRWARFALGDPKIVNDLHSSYQETIERIIHEYNDSLNRARRLCRACDLHLAGKPFPPGEISLDDVITYLNWLVHHLHTTQTGVAFMTSVQLLPFFIQETPVTPSHSPHRMGDFSRSQRKWVKAQKGILLRAQAASSSLLTPAALDSGSKEPVISSSLPSCSTHLCDFQDQLQELMLLYKIPGVANGRSASDQLQLYYHSSRQFMYIFHLQEKAALLLAYDAPSREKVITGKQRSTVTYIKPSNWTQHKTFKVEPNVFHDKALVEMKKIVNEIHPLLMLSNQCTHLTNSEKVLFALKQHYGLVHQYSTSAFTATLFHDRKESMLLWKCVYSAVNMKNPMNLLESHARFSLNNHTNEGSDDRGSVGLSSAQQLLQDETGRSISADANSNTPQDSYFSFLLLRHLHIRDLRNKCLGILNYFTSVERTLTINSVGLSQQADPVHSTRGIGRHLFKTPVDFKLSETEFMNFLEVENHDDYYVYTDADDASGEGCAVRVCDQEGKFIVYDSAKSHLTALEEELLIVASYYIQMESLKEDTSKDKKDGDSSSLSKLTDMFAILLDLWCSEVSFQEQKMKVVNHYVEAYHSVYDGLEKNKLAEVILSLISLRPRFDLNSAYFTGCYKLEVACLKQHSATVSTFLTDLMEEERAYNKSLRVSEVESSEGLPHPVPHAHPVCLSGDLGVGVSHYLLECLSSLSVLSLLPHTVKQALSESMEMSSVKDANSIITMHTRLWRKTREKWMSYQMGSDFSAEIFMNLFSSSHTEDPHLMVKTLSCYCKQYLLHQRPTTPSEIQTSTLQASCDVLQLLTSRNTLLIAAQKTAVLHALYKEQLYRLEEEKCHAFLRYQPFSSSTHFSSDCQLEDFVRPVHDSKIATQLDRFSSEHVPLAVMELEDRDVGRFSFRSKDELIKILTDRNGLRNIITTVQTQVAAQNSLLIACQQNALIINNTANLQEDRKFSTFADLVRSASQHSDKLQLITVVKDSFVSLQREKGAVRDHMLAKFSSSSMQSRTQEEIVKLKFSLISDFCINLISSMACHSLRQQITLVYQKLDNLLRDYPSTREAYFTMGGMKIPAVLDSVKPTYGRPRAIMSADGRSLLNLFYIPHVSEILTMYSSLSLYDKRETLVLILRLSSTLYDIIMYHCASGKLAKMCKDYSFQSSGIEDIGHDVHQLQFQLNQLDNPTDPQDVLNLLSLQRECLLHSHTIVVNHYLRRTLLVNENHALLKTLDDLCVPVLRDLYNISYQPCLQSYPLMPLPQSLAGGGDSTNLFPWRRFVEQNGVCLVSSTEVADIFSCVFLSIASLSSAGRQIASGELMGMSLLLEDVLLTSNLPAGASSPRFHCSPSVFSQHQTFSSITPRISRTRRLSQVSLSSAWWPNSSSHVSVCSSPLPPLPPISAMKLLSKFLFVCLQVEQLRVEWGYGLVGVASQRITKDACHLNDLFQVKIVSVARRMVARQEAKALLRSHAETDTVEESLSTTTLQTDTDISVDDIEQSKALNELSLREAQLSRLRDMVEQLLLQEEIRFVSNLQKISFQEFQRDAETLPLDLWKKSIMKEIVGVSRPHLVEDFLLSLQSNMAVSLESSSVMEIPQNHFTLCINQLSSAVLEREKECYQLYASFYESSLQNLYHQLYLKNQEVEQFQQLLEKLSTESREENLVMVAETTFSLIMDITALHLQVTDLQQQHQNTEEKLRSQILKEYQSLMSELQTSCISVKNRYEQYRKRLFKEALSALYNVKQQAFSNVTALREKLSGNPVSPPPLTSQFINHCVQDHNVHLTALVTKLRSLYHWRKQQMSDSAKRKFAELEGELEYTKKELVHLTMKSDSERQSLNHQIQALQKSLIQEEKRCSLLLKELESEKQRRTSAYAAGLKDKMSSMNHDQQKSQLDLKISEMVEQLEEKDQMLKTMEAGQHTDRRKFEHERIRSAKVLSSARQQLKQEKQLKLEAFHQLEDLLKTEEDTVRPQRPQTSAVLSSRVRTLTTSKPVNTTSTRVARPKSVGGRLRTATPSEVASLSQEIGALQLI